MAFKCCIFMQLIQGPVWLQTLVSIDSEPCQTLFPNFCTLPSEVAVLFNSNLIKLPFLTFQSAAFAQNSVWSISICSYAPCLFRDQQMIERLS